MPTFGSLFSGIGGFDLGFERAGWKCLWQIEVDRDCNRVLRRWWPDVRRYGNVQTVDPAALEPVDLLVGGFPCQDLSVAGRREGLAGERSRLFFEFMRVATALRPRWVLVENVPGLLSSNGTEDMGAVLWAMGELGHWWAYRVLDAQYFGVAQRRRRPFVVGDARTRSGAAQVLLEPESLPGDPPSRGAAGKVAPALVETGAGTSRVGGQNSKTEAEFLVGLDDVAHAVAAGAGGSKHGSGRDGQDDFVIAAPLTSGSASSDGVNKPGRRREDDANLVVGPIRTNVYNNSDPTMEIQQIAVVGIDVRNLRLRQDGKSGSLQAKESGSYSLNYQNPIIVARPIKAGGNDRQDESHETYVIDTPDVAERHGVAHTLKAEGADASEDGTGRGVPLVAATLHPGHEAKHSFPGDGGEFNLVADDAVQVQWASGGGRLENPTAQALRADAERSYQFLRQTMIVRRLTPTECERLQGFPDGWTAADADGRPISDSARYRMLGNAVCVSVAEWIARRMLEIHVPAKNRG